VSPDSPGLDVDADLSAIRTAVEGLGIWLAIWETRREPDARARRAAAYAIAATDVALAATHRIRARLVTETGQADREAAARADELLANTRDGPGRLVPGRDRRRNQTSPEAKAPAEGIIRPGGDKSRAPHEAATP
jgi:hypothetical protein